MQTIRLDDIPSNEPFEICVMKNQLTHRLIWTGGKLVFWQEGTPIAVSSHPIGRQDINQTVVKAFISATFP